VIFKSNPFNPSTTIEFSLPQASHTTLTVYNILGLVVAMLVNEELNVGRSTVGRTVDCAW